MHLLEGKSMAYESETGQNRGDPSDPHMRGGVRPHEFPSRASGGRGAIIALVVVALLIGVVLLSSAFTGGEVPDEGTAPAAETTPAPAPTEAPTTGN